MTTYCIKGYKTLVTYEIRCKYTTMLEGNAVFVGIKDKRIYICNEARQHIDRSLERVI